MSFKKYFFLISTITVLFTASCEDKKKATEVKTETIKEASDSLTLPSKVSEVEKTTRTKSYPKISNENAVDFLTTYGKENPETKVLITTFAGTIELELFNDAPLHRANFIYLVKQGYFDETFFYRVVPNFIIQGGNSDLRSTSRKRASIGNYILPAELHNGRSHEIGTLSGAKEYRENPDKNSAPFEFFIFLGPQTSTGHLNGNYTVFGKVSKGMNVVKKIANLPSDDGDWPLQNVYIEAKVIE
ncbi:MAG: peptidyl-prolyl cis-trans isomerase A (cyclophilin A) [Sediminicola sp.]|jgi:peptidyl-prolyl cis-trans isomerase A (cyclophilin A)|tara:strand:- start:2026 stop:2757 length:732 start_codon:yes stop_codon:yes gene_type:complete